jgi:hypothetical protein
MDDIFSQYDFQKEWNTPPNVQLQSATQRPGGQIFLCPTLDCPLKNRTTYLAVERPADLPSLVKPAMVLSSSNGQLLLIEDHSAVIHWMEPVDLNSDALLTFARNPDSSTLLGPHRQGLQYVTDAGRYDGVLARGVEEDEVKRLLGLNMPPATLEPSQQEKVRLMRILGERLHGSSPRRDRLVAALLLGQLGFQTPLARELLQQALQDNDPAVRKAAKLSLEKLPPFKQNG